MAAPGRTIDAHLIVGTDSWLVDLTDDTASLSVNGEASITQQAVLGDRYEDALANSSTHMIDVGTAYVGEGTEALRDRFGASSGMPWVCVFDEVVNLVYVMSGLLTGIPESAPTNDAITTSFGFPQAERFFGDGEELAVAFALRNAATSSSVGAIGTADTVFLIVTKFTPSAATNITVTGLTAQSVAAPGIWNLGSPGTAQTGATVTAAAVAASDEIDGFVLVVTEVDA